MKKILIVVDMQNDFISGTLGSKEAAQAVPNVVQLIEGEWNKIFATKDTHYENYLSTFEGQYLPVPHCLKHTRGWDLESSIFNAIAAYDHAILEKPTFGSLDLIKRLEEAGCKDGECEITLCGVCTDICVISNALLIRANMPNTVIQVVANACAGVTPEKHLAALEVMRSCQIQII